LGSFCYLNISYLSVLLSKFSSIYFNLGISSTYYYLFVFLYNLLNPRYVHGLQTKLPEHVEKRTEARNLIIAFSVGLLPPPPTILRLSASQSFRPFSIGFVQHSSCIAVLLLGSWVCGVPCCTGCRRNIRTRPTPLHATPAFNTTAMLLGLCCRLPVRLVAQPRRLTAQLTLAGSGDHRFRTVNLMSLYGRLVN
jgi:hypothetical protein